MKHTQGNWKTEATPDGLDVWSDNQCICIVDNNPDREDNAKLIASAPDQQRASILLYDLIRKLAQVVPKQDFDVIRPDWNKAMNAHEQAINH